MKNKRYRFFKFFDLELPIIEEECIFKFISIKIIYQNKELCL